MSDAGLPPDRPGEALPNFGAHTPAPPPMPPPAPRPEPYQPPSGYPAPGGMSTGAKVGLGVGIGCLVLIVIVIAIIAIGAIGAAILSSGDDNEPWTPPDSADRPSSRYVGPTESEWKSGANWLEPPADSEQPGPFLPQFSTPEEYLWYAMGADYDFTVVFTDDPTYNCGMAKADPAPDWVIGCYNPDYGRTIFLWWGPDAKDEMKQLILLHEYSHYWQNFNYFDATHSAVEAGLFSDPDFVQDVWETDATCRIYDEWHYTDLREIDSYTVSPCGDTPWGKRWFENELLKRGVKITDY